MTDPKVIISANWKQQMLSKSFWYVIVGGKYELCSF